MKLLFEIDYSELFKNNTYSTYLKEKYPRTKLDF